TLSRFIRKAEKSTGPAKSYSNHDLELVVSFVEKTIQDAKKVKEKQEKDKIRTKPDENEKRGKARQCKSLVTVEKAEKRRNTDSRDQYWQILEDVLVKEKQEKDKIRTKPDKKGSVEKPGNVQGQSQ
nr:hypothetical protein [Tanacetum cinerariifolium]